MAYNSLAIAVWKVELLSARRRSRSTRRVTLTSSTRARVADQSQPTSSRIVVYSRGARSRRRGGRSGKLIIDKVGKSRSRWESAARVA